MLTGYGLARRVHIALIALLVIGVAGSFWMSIRARNTAEDRAVEQAQVIADSSLTLVFRPDDLQHDATSGEDPGADAFDRRRRARPQRLRNRDPVLRLGRDPLLDRGRQHRPAIRRRTRAHPHRVPGRTPGPARRRHPVRAGRPALPVGSRQHRRRGAVAAGGRHHRRVRRRGERTCSSSEARSPSSCSPPAHRCSAARTPWSPRRPCGCGCR